ncbi:helix-turn-helix transcriptional regulator [Micromonospora sp. WMMD1082]|uniref:helix-turn-helix transcriptional regulator n=1 Tax=Micromonospora sp. WMMD1082 TaxID=3016104 RepID=UPI002416E8C7|nr:helix-turn-helix transcriptional regulator [Micromonospora sp. WMMD1082]MDG4798794.1 helix-turn-helix transcriptional regulator [Micromonospora sp. WMMD1082]
MTTKVPTAHRFDSQDPATIHGFLTSAYGTEVVIRAAAGTGYRFRHHRVDAGPFWLEAMDQTTRLDIDVGPTAALVVGQVVSGRVDRHCRNVDGRFGPGDVFLAAAPGLPYSVRWLPGKVTMCLLGLSVLGRVAGGAQPDPATTVQFTGLTPISPALTRLWRHTTSYLNHVVLGNPHAYREPLVIANAARLLAASALAVFPHTTAGWPTATDRRAATTATLRRATAFIEEYADRDIGAADIAAAAQVSLRALQLAFRRHLDTTPMAHLRRVRLDRAHRDLLQADPRQETVSAIASRWGFLSHSRFTARYHATYGIPPSRTLHA